MASYFSFFPSLLYGNTAVTNIIAKVQFEKSVASNLAVFYPYTIEQGERADQIASFYYGSPDYDWIIYLSNDIMDPYHDWPKSEETFNEFLKQKYGSIPNAQLGVAYYRVNYETDDTILTPAAYSALNKNQKKYWTPQIGYNSAIIGYERKPLDIVSETNKIVELTGSFSNTAPVSNSFIKQSSSVTGTVAFSNASHIIIKHVTGEWNANNPVYFQNNSVIASSLTAVDTLQEPIPSDEFSYWIPVSYYDDEAEKNERRKNIRLLNARYVSLIERDMRDLLQS
jgi:hypothetical protein